MEPNELTTLRRDCEAVQIPAGTHLTLRAGEQAIVTQSLGGSYTVIVNGNLFRIDGKDADALGKEATANVPKEASAGTSGPISEKAVWDQLRTCFDPEIPVNIVDLGLVYDMQMQPIGNGGNRVNVKMTLTAPGCGMGDILKSDVERKILSIEGVTEAHVELVWDPPWNQGMLTDAAKLQLGLM